MKYKVIGIVTIILAVVVSVLAPAALASQNDAEGRYHQHLSATLRPEDEVSDGTFNTHLPLIEIETGGVEIPGKPLHDPIEPEKYLANQFGGMVFSTAEDGSSTVRASMCVIDHGETVNRPEDEPELETEIRIRVRGNSSRKFDKSSYQIHLVNADGTNRDEPLLGMDAHHEWALHGPFLDKSLLRNYMCYNLAGEFMDYAPNVRFCELMVDGEYRGVYVLTETITAGKNGARLPLTVRKKGNTYSGYLLCLDRAMEPELRNISSFTVYALRTRMNLEIRYPGTGNLTETIAESIRQDFSDFEKALYSYDYDSSKYGYKNLIDVTSFCDYFILNEISCNYDAGWLSTYMYKGRDGLFRMCVWDCNSAFDNYQESFMDFNDFGLQEALWYTMLFKDPDFVEELIARYRYLRTTVLSDDYMIRYIDDTVSYLGPAIERNFSVWGYTFDEDSDLLQPAERNPRSYEEAVSQIKTFLLDRTAWMDENIDALRSYSAGSRTKKFDENAN